MATMIASLWHFAMMDAAAMQRCLASPFTTALQLYSASCLGTALPSTSSSRIAAPPPRSRRAASAMASSVASRMLTSSMRARSILVVAYRSRGLGPSARAMSLSYTRWRDFGESFFESTTPCDSCSPTSGEMTTAVARTGPAMHPLPTSSMPTRPSALSSHGALAGRRPGHAAAFATAPKAGERQRQTQSSKPPARIAGTCAVQRRRAQHRRLAIAPPCDYLTRRLNS
mmetsp:Transcript_42296/g.111877  ORF Transcript_42296/g.111877 Transcript_42296/m.111877 type:complete len:228 (-) Transcript_42296:27-710(-)